MPQTSERVGRVTMLARRRLYQTLVAEVAPIYFAALPDVAEIEITLAPAPAIVFVLATGQRIAARHEPRLAAQEFVRLVQDQYDLWRTAAPGALKIIHERKAPDAFKSVHDRQAPDTLTTPNQKVDHD